MENDTAHLCGDIPSIPWDIRSEGGRTGKLFFRRETQLVGSQDYSVQLKFKLENSFGRKKKYEETVSKNSLISHCFVSVTSKRKYFYGEEKFKYHSLGDSRTILQGEEHACTCRMCPQSG